MAALRQGYVLSSRLLGAAQSLCWQSSVAGNVRAFNSSAANSVLHQHHSVSRLGFSSRPVLTLLLANRQPGFSRGFADLPPHTELAMPSLSPTMSQGNIASWKKKEGDEIAAGDVLAEVETDKATMEWEAQDEGFLAKILKGDGSKDLPVGTPVAVVVEDKEAVSAFKDYQPGQGGGAQAAASQGGESEPAQQEAAEPAGEESSSSGGGGDYPPHSVMGLPALSPTMSQGNLATWKKKEGDEVAAGDSIAEIETDKATMDWESQDDGFIAKLLVPEGSKDIAVGQPVMVFVEDKDSISAFKDFQAGGGAKQPAKQDKPKQQKQQEPPKQEQPQQRSRPQQQQQSQKAAPPSPQPSGGRVRASPYAHKLAAEAGVDISQATATGAEGRIVAADVQKLIESGGGKASQQTAAGAGQQMPQAQEGTTWTDIPNSQIRRVTAKRLLESKQTIPHYYLTIDTRADKLVQLRQQLNQQLAARDGGKLSVNDFVVKAAALALRKVPGVNASWTPDYIRQYHYIDISVAVQTPQGLMVPVVRDADHLGLSDISSAVKKLATQAKEGKLSAEDMSGGTFTITNLGMYGVDSFAGIINPPQAAILAIGTTNKRVMLSSDGKFEEASIMSCTLSCDHRVVDGALGAQWLQAFRGYIEDPVSMML
jgi:pyruvate dehydrogenase E2 component (dihydrolipoamide acetyltransferase)